MKQIKTIFTELKLCIVNCSLLIALTLSTIPAYSQDSIRCGTWFSANVHYGFIVPLYSNSMNILIRAHVPAAEFDYLYKASGNEPWQVNFHCPETGVALFYGWLGNPAQLGNETGAYPFINFHLQQSYTEALYLRMGIGLAYMPVIWERVSDYKNNVIGAHLNALINLRLTIHFYLSEKMRLEAGLGITHCSDGNFTTPNLGINLLTVNTGLSYCCKPCKAAPIYFADTALKKKPENEFIAAGGLSEIEPPGGIHYGAATFSYIRYYMLSEKSKLGGGIDVFYNAANIAIMENDGIYLQNNLQNTQLGIKASYELALGRLSLPLEAGYYLYTKYQSPANMYNRFGLRYYAGKHIILNLTLLTHFAEAVYIEWGVGYRF